MKTISNLTMAIVLSLFVISCNDNDTLTSSETNELSINELAKIKQVGDNHTIALNAVYNDILVNNNNQIFFKTNNIDPRQNVNNVLVSVGESIYSGSELVTYNQSINKGESNLTQANISDYNSFNAVLNQSFNEISSSLSSHGLNSNYTENYLDDIKSIMLNSFDNSDLNNLTLILDSKFNL